MLCIDNIQNQLNIEVDFKCNTGHTAQEFYPKIGSSCVTIIQGRQTSRLQKISELKSHLMFTVASSRKGSKMKLRSITKVVKEDDN